MACSAPYRLLPFISIFLLFLQIQASVLSVNFYEKTCPRMESIIKKAFLHKIRESRDPKKVAPGLLRLFFHDCFVQGCDGSVLLQSTDGKKAERDALPNASLLPEAFDAIEEAKDAVERRCPGVVSCADILAVLARDATVYARGPSWEVAKGRRDGRESEARKAEDELPSGDTTDVKQLLTKFKGKGFNALEMVALSGAHTIGTARCSTLSSSLRSNLSNSTWPRRRHFIGWLRSKCPQEAQAGEVALDTRTPTRFDSKYFVGVWQREGVLPSDEALLSSRSTRRTVSRFASNESLFFQVFSRAMFKLGALVPPPDSHSEIRRRCSTLN